MDELLRNGSGYVDLTAYKAIKNADGGVIMNKGEIWTIKHGKYTRMAVVLAVHERVCNVLVLNDEKSSENDFEVIAKGVKYTDPCMISYAFNDNFLEFVKCMKDHEFETLTDIVRGELGFNALYRTDYPILNEEAQKEIDDLKMKLEGAERMLDEVTAKYENEKSICDGLQRELAETATELEKASCELTTKKFSELKQNMENTFEKAYIKLSIKYELLQDQNEKLIDKLAELA